MTRAGTSIREFEPGTTGWTAADLDDPAIEAQWDAGRYEIIDGVLTKMPPAYFDHGAVTAELIVVLRSYCRERSIATRFSFDVDLILDEDRVLRADMVMMTRKDAARQKAAAKAAGRKNLQRTRILVPPILAVESISPDHEQHDRRLKRRWYAEFGVPNYWIADAYRRTMDCLVLRGGEYEVDASGSRKDELRPSAFPGLVIRLKELWGAT